MIDLQQGDCLELMKNIPDKSWDRRLVSNIMGPIGRRHETISILTKKGKVRKIRVPYLQKNQYNFKKIKNDLSIISGSLNNPQKFEDLKKICFKKGN